MICLDRLLKQNLISCSSVMIKRELILKYPMSDQKDIHEDFAAWINILKETKYAYGVQEPLLIYRISGTSKSGNKLHAALMNWRTYRLVGLNPLVAAYYMIWYTVNGLLKYAKIR